jgi:hypothetical protein
MDQLIALKPDSLDDVIQDTGHVCPESAWIHPACGQPERLQEHVVLPHTAVQRSLRVAGGLKKHRRRDLRLLDIIRRKRTRREKYLNI